MNARILPFNRLTSRILPHITKPPAFCKLYKEPYLEPIRHHSSCNNSYSTHLKHHNMSYTIPQVQTAAIVPQAGADLQITDSHPVPTIKDLSPGQCLVKLHCTGVCHTDLHAKKGDWPLPAKTPLIGGHEGVGDVVLIAENTPFSPVKVGDRVGIKWLADSCLQCESCRKGFEQSTCNR